MSNICEILNQDEDNFRVSLSAFKKLPLLNVHIVTSMTERRPEVRAWE